MTTIIASGISTAAELNLAIEAADTQVANGGTYEIDLTGSGTITFGTTALEAINLNAGNVLVIQGDNATIDGGGTQRGLFDFAGSLIWPRMTCWSPMAHRRRVTGTTATAGCSRTPMLCGISHRRLAPRC